MFVIKRNGMNEIFDSNKIQKHLNCIASNNTLDVILVIDRLVQSIYSGITTTVIDSEMAKICSNMITIDPKYGNLAGNILTSALHKRTNDDFVLTMNNINKNVT